MSAIKKFEDSFVNLRRQRIHTVCFAPPGTAVAVLFFAHGLNEQWVCRALQLLSAFTRLAQAGVMVLSMDMHGHGKSEPLEPYWRAYVGKFQYLVDDFYEFIHQYTQGPRAKDIAGLPRFIGGHSTGALIAAHAALQEQGTWSGLVLHSPSLDVEWTLVMRIQAWIGRLLSFLVPAARVVTAVRLEDMSQDLAVLDAIRADPLIAKGNVCARTACVILDAFNDLGPKAKQLTVPVYVGHGTNDRCTSLPASKRFIQSVSSKDATLYEFVGGYHELLMGPEWQDATDRIAAWISKRAAARS